ncbi:D-alanyl-D-alanine carboxypeptidase family protein [Acetobacterium sp.]|jgi:D-alanyl-D-alanine carboxypeptidase (penicillin-binding protein 5/6)|uniref:D-alanyl-D-alanine carboxypeptidase family protein n=1 Tax=Acetobacterium sp. TaxID=1872094 RepID=UPI0027230BA1|nr:D-alanyl-D-alanine carboxypeptidase [Acetobacterium sp.]MDO9491212.1 D-alanyl-D-alanine carboxypeptidase [Acetobacterium sp.]
MKRKIGLLLILSLVFCTSGVLAAGLPAYGADEGVIIYEVNSGDILFAQKQNEKFYPASTTKLMTALVAIEHGDLNENFTVGEEIESLDEDSSTAGLEVEEVISLNELLYALLLPSGNDAAETIAVNIGKKIAGDSSISSDKAYEAFIAAMNKKAKEMGMTGTNFTNPHGLHSEKHYSTPADMLILAKTAFSDTTIKAITRAKVHEVQTNKLKHKWNNSNLLLYSNFTELSEEYRVANNLSGTNPVFNGYATSGKTGFTEEANKCLVFEGEGNDKDMIGIIFNADQTVIFKEASDTINAVVKEYELLEWLDPEDEDQVVQVVNYHVFDGNKLKYKTNDALITAVPQANKDSYSAKVKWDENKVMGDATLANLEMNIKAGEQIGELQVYNGETLVEVTPLYAVNDMKARNWTDYPILYWYVTIIVILMLLAILRIMFVQFMHKNNIKYKKIKIKKKPDSSSGRSSSQPPKRRR